MTKTYKKYIIVGHSINDPNLIVFETIDDFVMAALRLRQLRKEEEVVGGGGVDNQTIFRLYKEVGYEIKETEA